MSINITSVKIGNNLWVNSIPDYPAEMTILKVYIYKKPWANGEGISHLTLFSMIPANEYMGEISMFKCGTGERPRTNGVFVKIIGSISGLVLTNKRIGLRTYQDHLEQNGWSFVGTVSGVKGTEYETARKMAFAKIQKLKKQKKEDFTKSIMLGHLNDIEAQNDAGVDIQSSIDKLRFLIKNADITN